MDEHELRAEESLVGSPSASESLSGLNLEDFVKSMMQDLRDLRSGKITIFEANARSKLAHQAMRGVHLLLQGARMFNKEVEQNAKAIEALESENEN